MKKYIFETADDLAKELGIYLIDRFSHPIHLAISGGSTPKILFEFWAKNYPKSDFWQNVYFYWVDERCVPPTDKESNYLMTKSTLFDKVAIPPENIFRVKGEDDPYREAQRYADLILDHVPKSIDGQPVFDIVLLGMGADGHTASIFPDNLALIDSEKVCDTAVHPESGQIRVTLTGKPIMDAREVYFLVSGSSKAEIMSDIWTRKAGHKQYPAAHFTNADWWIDKDSAALL